MLRGLGGLIITIGFAVCVGACLRPDSIDVTNDINAPKIFLRDAPAVGTMFLGKPCLFRRY